MADDEQNGLGNQIKETAKQEVKNQGKKVGKKIFKMMLPHLVVILIFLMVASAVFAIFTGIVDIIKGFGQNVLYNVDESGIEISDEEIDKLIESIESTGIDLKDLELLRRN